MPYLELGLPERLRSDVALVQTVNLNDMDNFPSALRDALLRLYADPSFKEAISYGSQYQLNDSVVYLFDHIQEMASATYVPTDDDILRARVRTIGITESAFQVKNMTYRFFE
jgi:guanine nucleotide-binding protein G(i) subunit alpha